MIRLTILLSLISVLMGCKSTPTVQTHYITLEKSWIVDCGYVKPPEKEVYLVMSDRQRAIIMSKLYSMQLQQTKSCNNRFKEIRIYNDKAEAKNKSLKE